MIVRYFTNKNVGTGKTTTARKMGKVYYDMGFLSTAEVVESSATDLIGEYIGHTGPKTQKLIEKALGRVLFIDEAYRLAEGHFAKEAMDEIVDCITKPAYAQKLIIILAGYDEDINRLMSINPGLTSRFPETVNFRPLDKYQCLQLLVSLLKKKKQFDATLFDNSPPDLTETICNRFEQLGQLPSWANARDVGTIAKAITAQLLRESDPESQDPIKVKRDVVLAALNAMLSERQARAKRVGNRGPGPQTLPMDSASKLGNPIQTSINTSNDLERASSPNQDQQDETLHTEPNGESTKSEIRDAGVSDEVWAQLELDKQAARRKEKDYEDLQTALAEAKKEQERQEELARKKDELARLEKERIEKELRDQQAKAEEAERARLAAEQERLRKKWEQERLERERERRRREEELARLQREKERAEAERRLEQARQRKLRTMGVCVAGFQWIKQVNGYRCAGGSHFVSDAQLNMT
jgi:hypothetical protein